MRVAHHDGAHRDLHDRHAAQLIPAGSTRAVAEGWVSKLASTNRDLKEYTRITDWAGFPAGPHPEWLVTVDTQSCAQCAVRKRRLRPLRDRAGHTSTLGLGLSSHLLRRPKARGDRSSVLGPAPVLTSRVYIGVWVENGTRKNHIYTASPSAVADDRAGDESPPEAALGPDETLTSALSTSQGTSAHTERTLPLVGAHSGGDKGGEQGGSVGRVVRSTV